VKKIFRTVDPELLIWTAGLLILAFYPFETGHFSVCPLKNLGFSFCPGCGLGMSLHYLFHLEFTNSFHAHPLGIFAFIIISLRIIGLAKKSFTQYLILTGRNYNG